MRLNSSSARQTSRASAAPRLGVRSAGRASRPPATRPGGRHGLRPARRRQRRPRDRGTTTRSSSIAASSSSRSAPRWTRRSPLLRLARGQLESPPAPPPPAPLAAAPDGPRGVEKRRCGVGGVEPGIGVHGITRHAQQLVPATCEPGDRGGARHDRGARRTPRASARVSVSESPGARSERNARTARSGEPPERNELAAREDRSRDRAEHVRDEHDHRVRGGFLEILQQRIGGVLVQQVRVGDDVDAPLGLVGPHVQVAMERANLVDPDHLSKRLEQEEVGVRPGRHAAFVTEQRGREQACGSTLADPGRAVEEIGVRRALDDRRPQ